MKAALIAAATLVAGAAHAEPASLAALNAAVRAPAEVPAVRLSLRGPDAEAYALKSAGIARTSVERRSEGAAAALGFLCGLHEGAERSGMAAARGSDPHGRFVGAKLSFAFR